jgi:putative peptide maturation dehydrogenase
VARYRRTAYSFLSCHEIGFVDVELLLRGVVEPAQLQQLVGVSALTAEPQPLSEAELQLFLRTPTAAWREPDDGELAVSEALARKGLLVSDADGDEQLAELRRRDELLAGQQWHPFAALYHFLTRWRGQNVWHELSDAELAEAAAEIEGWGPPPPPFHSRGGAAVPLPAPARDGPLHDLLLRRRTTRGFDPERAMTAQELGVVLASTFGCHGYLPLGSDLVVLRKTSPSGGGLHPTEAYPLVRDVDGVEPGLYHYDVARHALEPVAALPAADVSELAVRLAAGQPYAGDAHALVVLTSRFGRNFWKYRQHDRAYAVLLMDAGHLSQTFYLVCADLGLGAFVTAAINGADAEEALGIDGFNEGAIALCGCGPPGPESPLDPPFLPFVPGETIL